MRGGGEFWVKDSDISSKCHARTLSEMSRVWTHTRARASYGGLGKRPGQGQARQDSALAGRESGADARVQRSRNAEELARPRRSRRFLDGETIVEKNESNFSRLGIAPVRSRIVWTRAPLW